jgi:hypothetical protein
MRRLSIVAMMALLAALPALAEDKASPSATQGFEMIKKLVGEWQTVDKDGKAADQITLSIKLTAGGSVVQETEFPGTEHEMVTMYHIDGKDLVLTHYCMLGNQPRMKAEPIKTPNELVFKFAGAGNLKSENDNHMHEGKITFVDDDHIKSEWTRCDGGKACETHAFTLVRKRK